MKRPAADACASYFHGYIEQVPDGDFAAESDAFFAGAMATLSELPEERWNSSYEPGKWTVKELVGHCIDTERIMSTRALAFARGDVEAYPGFDQDVYVTGARFDARSPASLLAEWKGLHEANAALRESFSEEELDRAGMADGKPTTVRALWWVIAGHERHHMRVLRERYL